MFFYNIMKGTHNVLLMSKVNITVNIDGNY